MISRFPVNQYTCCVTVSMGAREQDPNADTEGAKSNLKGLFNRNNQNRSNAGEKLETSKNQKTTKTPEETWNMKKLGERQH